MFVTPESILSFPRTNLCKSSSPTTTASYAPGLRGSSKRRSPRPRRRRAWCAPATEQIGVLGMASRFSRRSPPRKCFDARHAAAGGPSMGRPADCREARHRRVLSPPPGLGGQRHQRRAQCRDQRPLLRHGFAAAIEGAFFGITSIAVSLEWDDHANFARAAEIAVDVIRGLLDRRPPAGSLFNINIPTRALAGAPELRVVPMSIARYGEAFERRVDPRGRSYYWATNDPPPPPSPRESDVTALAAGKVTLTPLDYDLTHRGGLDELAAGPWRIG